MFDLDSAGHARTGTHYGYDPRGYLTKQIFGDGREVHRAADSIGNVFRTADMTERVYAKGGVLKRVGTTELEHDADGNLITKTLADGATWKYRWDAGGRLVSVDRPDGKAVSFTYDAFGRRLSKAFDGTTTEYVWDANDLVHERTRRGEQRGALVTWVFEPGCYAPLAKIEGRKRFGVVTDHLGAPTLLTTEAGKVAWKAQLDIYGVPQLDLAVGEEADRTTNPWRFPGQYEDFETGLYYNRFRYYDPALGTYLNEDPIGLRGGINGYAYVANSQWYFDPLGLAKVCGAKQKKAGLEREDLVEDALRGMFPKSHIIKEPYLRDAAGNIVRVGNDPARRLDILVVHPDGSKQMLEVTSELNVPAKAAQTSRTEAVMDAGGHYVRDPSTGGLIDVKGSPYEVVGI